MMCECGQDCLYVVDRYVCSFCSPSQHCSVEEKEREEERSNAPYKRWRKQVRERDQHRCQFPNCPGQSRLLETHHIRRWADDPSLRYDPDNGIVLCFDCHHSIQDKEEEWVEAFRDIAMDNARNRSYPELTILLGLYG